MYIYLYIYIYIYMCVCVCLCVYMYIQLRLEKVRKKTLENICKVNFSKKAREPINLPTLFNNSGL